MKKDRLKIGILGATSYIAKGLINNFIQSEKFYLHLYTRSVDKFSTYLESIGKATDKSFVVHEGYKEFRKFSCDAIINCVGVGTLNRLHEDYPKHFMVTEKYDNLAIEYLRKNPATLYISFSSGAVYGGKFSAAVAENTMKNIRVNHISTEDYYAITKLNSEAKHRSFKNLKIVDLRIFSYFSRFMDFKDSYFINEVMDCILRKKVLVTDSVNIVRDYVHPNDFFSLIKKCINAGEINAVYDVTSAKPVEKMQILGYFAAKYGLKYDLRRSLHCLSAAGSKSVYCSRYNKALEIGYKPKFTSMDTIEQESKYILKGLHSPCAVSVRRGV